MTVSAPGRKKKAVLFGAVAAAFLAVMTAAGGLWYANENKQVDQASKADCVLARRILDGTRTIPQGKAAVEEWEKNTTKLHMQIKNDLLSVNMAEYQYWAYNNAKGEEKPPAEAKQKDLADTANGHCSDAAVKLTFPVIAS
ncbi:hypothetical protein ACIBVL_11715 [Streptomyces sp. NPDC049687]|uniref:hypothetical protein n=1 Tax=Streptomyces sp. NPDC049687 TaxID=3365596 RepID=UPI00378A5F66